MYELDRHEAKHQVHHTPHELDHALAHPAASMSSRLTTEVRVELHVVRKGGFGIAHMQESIDVVLLSDDLVDDLGQGGLV